MAMDRGRLTNELMNTKQAVAQIHEWATHIAECVTDHANAIDAASAESGVIKGKLAAFERQLGEGFQGAEARLSDTFAKVDGLIAQLRGETTTTASELAAKCAKLEGAFSALGAAAGPPGLQPGGDAPGGHAMKEELRTLTENVRVLHDRMASSGDEMCNFKRVGTEQGQQLASLGQGFQAMGEALCQLVGRVSTLETTAGTAQAPEAPPDPWFRARAGQAAGPTANMAPGASGQQGQGGLFGGQQ